MYSHWRWPMRGGETVARSVGAGRLELKADLAVLSACETARGRAAAGEGMIGMSWAMFRRECLRRRQPVEGGVRGPRELMVSFHRALISPAGAGKARPAKSETLRRAALKMMKNPTEHPFYWAGFVLVVRGIEGGARCPTVSGRVRRVIHSRRSA